MLDDVTRDNSSLQGSNHGLVDRKARQRVADITQGRSQTQAEKERIHPCTSTVSNSRGRRGGTSGTRRSPSSVMSPTQLKLGT